MSRGWEGGSTRAWRKLRSDVLFRDGGLCQLKLEGCAVYADQVHHKDGVALGKITDPARLEAACASCNWKVGDPTAKADPDPNPPRTNW